MLTQLEVLDLSNNCITKIEGLHNLRRLKDLWLNDNHLESLETLQQDLEGPSQSLTCIYLAQNPIVSSDEEQFRQRLTQMLPNLEQIDADLVR